MPYSANADLPAGVKGLPAHGQDIYRAAYNSAEEKYKGSANDARRAKIAWAAVKNAGYTQDSEGKWQAPKAKSDGATKLEKAAPKIGDRWEKFIPFTKIDPISGEVEGYAFVEEPDHAGEIIDYKKSLPYFTRWSLAAQKRTGGNSKGNLREMHRDSAAGILTDFAPDDVNKGAYIKTKVVDPIAKQKVASYTYTGFSIGGRYIDRYPDPQNPSLMRYIADPIEISLVDAPCIPGATFKVVKGEGLEEEMLFKADHTNERAELYKGISLDDLSQAIRGAWYEQFQPHDSSDQIQASGEWVTEIFTDAVITCEDGKYYRYPYAKVSDDEIQFTGEKQEVEQLWIPKGAESSLPSSSLSSFTSGTSSPSTPSMPMLMPDMGKAQITIDARGINISKQAQPNITAVPDAGDEPLLPLQVADRPIDRAANPFNPTPIDPYSAAPPASELITHGDPAQSVEDAVNQIAAASNPKFGKENQPTSTAAAAVSKLKVKRKGVKIMANKPAPAAESAPAAAPPVKKDAASVLQSAQSLVNDIKSQASKEGQIDQDKLDQLAAALQVTVDQVGDHSSELESKEKSTASSLGTSVASNPLGTSTATTPSASSSSSSDDSHTSTESTMSKNEPNPVANPASPEPFSTTPPRAAMNILIGGEAAQALVPQMIEALAKNQPNRARALCSEDLGNGVRKFDEPMFNEVVMLSLHTVADQLGFTRRNYPNLLRKLGQYTDSGDADEDLGNGLKKAITAAGMPGINLLPLVRLMLPVYAGLGRRIPITQPRTMGSDKATWRTQIGFGTFDEVAAMSVAEASIGAAMGESFITFETPYRDTTDNSSATLKSLSASRGFDDPLQVATINSLAGLLRIRERNLIGQNYAAISNPASVTGTPGGSGTVGNSDDKFTVTALTYRGWLNYQKNALVGTDGSITPIGETVGTTTSAVNLSAAANVTITWPIVKGAVAYAVYYLPHGVVANGHIINVYFANTTGALTSLPSSGNKAPTSDTSANANGYEGLTAWCELTSIYSQTISTNRSLIDNAGGGLTTGNGGIVQINQVMRELWDNWQTAPTLAIMSSQMVQTLTAKLLALNNAALYRIEVQQERGTITGGAFVTSIVNQFAPLIDGVPRSIEIMGHPYYPNGTILFLSETVPYPLSRTARTFEAEQLVPPTYWPLAQTTLAYPFATTLSEVLECFHPSAQAAIQGIDVTL